MQDKHISRRTYGRAPIFAGKCDIHLSEQMHYLYLPIVMGGNHGDARVPRNLMSVGPMIQQAQSLVGCAHEFIYLSAVRGIASPGNSLNRPGWHCDGFGTNDINAVWWRGQGTRFAIQEFENISDDDQASLTQFDSQVVDRFVTTYGEGHVYILDPYVVHAVPLIEAVCERQFVKLSFSNERYNLDGNSHNYLFNYTWPMVMRHASRNVTAL